MSLYWRSLTQVRLSLEQICVKDLLPVGSKKPSALGLQGGVVKMGSVVWAKELKYLHAHVDNSTDGWGVLISTTKGNKERATITDDPGVPNASIELDIAVDKKGKSVEVVTPAEVARLKKLVRNWVAQRKDDVAVIDDDDDPDLPGGRRSDVGGGDRNGDVGGGGAGNSGGGAGCLNGADDGGGGDGGAEGDGGADVGTNVEGDGGDGDDVPSGTDAAIDDLLGVNRMRHPLSPTASEERPGVRRKRRSKWITTATTLTRRARGGRPRMTRTRISLSVMVLLLRAANRECF